MAKGKWAQGIKPRGFHWIIEDQLAICERPGGYGANHRRVRRQEEVIWIRENNFSFVVSLIPSDHNLHSYDEQGMPWKHWPFSPGLDLDTALPQLYGELHTLLSDGRKLLLHMEEVGDRMAGLMAGYLRWTRPGSCHLRRHHGDGADSRAADGSDGPLHRYRRGNIADLGRGLRGLVPPGGRVGR